MARRTILGYLLASALASTACNDKTDVAPTTTSSADLDSRCVRLAKICADKGKHVDKITVECKQAATKQVAKGCADKVIATYDCYEKQLCAGADKVWTIEDLHLLATRHKKCVAEQTASRQCAEN